MLNFHHLYRIVNDTPFHEPLETGFLAPPAAVDSPCSEHWSPTVTFGMRSTRVHRHIKAPRAAVYRLLLDPAVIAKWKVPDGMTAHVHSFQAREGGSIRVSLTYVEPTGSGKTSAHTDTYHGRFVRLVPNELVVEVDQFETADPALSGEMTSTIMLADAANGGTDVVGIHEGLPPGVTIADNATGWQMALAKLAALAEADSR